MQLLGGLYTTGGVHTHTLAFILKKILVQKKSVYLQKRK